MDEDLLVVVLANSEKFPDDRKMNLILRSAVKILTHAGFKAVGMPDVVKPVSADKLERIFKDGLEFLEKLKK